MAKRGRRITQGNLPIPIGRRFLVSLAGAIIAREEILVQHRFAKPKVQTC
jgi:hypothetical protein